jgi:hypothetical protein
VIHILRVSTQNIERGHYTLGGKYVKNQIKQTQGDARNQETKDRKISTKNMDIKSQSKWLALAG